MNPLQAAAAVETSARVTARTGQGDTHATGTVVAYSLVPQVLIVTDDGRRVWWRADMTDVDDDG